MLKRFFELCPDRKAVVKLYMVGGCRNNGVWCGAVACEMDCIGEEKRGGRVVEGVDGVRDGLHSGGKEGR